MKGLRLIPPKHIPLAVAIALAVTVIALTTYLLIGSSREKAALRFELKGSSVIVRGSFSSEGTLLYPCEENDRTRMAPFVSEWICAQQTGNFPLLDELSGGVLMPSYRDEFFSARAEKVRAMLYPKNTLYRIRFTGEYQPGRFIVVVENNAGRSFPIFVTQKEEQLVSIEGRIEPLNELEQTLLKSIFLKSYTPTTVR